MNCDKNDLLLYAVTDRHWLDGRRLIDVVRESLDGGVTMVQLREKTLEEGKFLEEAKELQTLCRERGVPFLVNDNVEIAREMNADGVHVGQSDMEAQDVRAILGPDKILGVSLWLDSVVTVQVYSENSTVSDEEVRNAGYDDIRKYINSRQQAAISNFLGMDEAHINEKINDVLQGNLREIVSEMTVDQILTNRKQMAVSVVENARPDLAKMGLEVVTFNVQDVKDAVDAMGHNHGVIEAIGVEQEELVKKRASIAKAEAERDVSCAKAAAAMAANEKEIEAQTAIAQRNNELELAKSKLKAEADKAAADANAAGMIQTNLRAKEVKESEADAEIARQKKMVDLAAQEAEVQQRKLDAEVRKQADAELYRRQKEAEAQKYEAERAAEAAKFAKQQEAEGIALVGKAEAEAIRQKGLAEAEAMKQKAEAYKQYNDAAVAEMMIKVLPEIARSVAQPLSSIDKVSIIGGDASGVSGVSGNVPVLMAQTMEAMKEATGIDMRDIVRANSIEAKTDRNITIKTEPEGEA